MYVDFWCATIQLNEFWKKMWRPSFSLVCQFHIGFIKYKYGENNCAKTKLWKLCEFERQKEVITYTHTLGVLNKGKTKYSRVEQRRVEHLPAGMSRCHVLYATRNKYRHTYISHNFKLLIFMSVCINRALGQSFSLEQSISFIKFPKSLMYTHIKIIMIKIYSTAICNWWLCSEFFFDQWTIFACTKKVQPHFDKQVKRFSATYICIVYII